MSEFLDSLGLDSEQLVWQDLASCQGMDVNYFFDKYEEDSYIAKNVDQTCLHCPVLKLCYNYGLDSKQDGVWGGVYWAGGLVDRPRNRHKTTEVWQDLENQLGQQIIRD